MLVETKGPQGGHRDAGSATAEFVVLLPVISTVIWVAVALGSTQLLVMKAQVAAANLVRAAQLGRDNDWLTRLSQELGVEYEIEYRGSEVICFKAKPTKSLGAFSGLAAPSQICGLAPAGGLSG